MPVEKYLNLTSYYGQQVEMDNQARVLLPQILREDGQSWTRKSLYWGKMSYLEVQNLKRASKQNLAANELTAERSPVAGIDSQTAEQLSAKPPRGST